MGNEQADKAETLSYEESDQPPTPVVKRARTAGVLSLVLGSLIVLNQAIVFPDSPRELLISVLWQMAPVAGGLTAAFVAIRAGNLGQGPRRMLRRIATYGVIIVAVGVAGVFLSSLQYVRAKRTIENQIRAGRVQRLFAIRNSMTMYLEAHGDRFPDSLATLREWDPDLIDWEEVLDCPATQEPERVAYIYAPPAPDVEWGKAVMIFDRKSNHSEDRIALFADGHVEFLSESEFQAVLALPENQAFADALRRAEQASGDESEAQE